MHKIQVVSVDVNSQPHKNYLNDTKLTRLYSTSHLNKKGDKGFDCSLIDLIGEAGIPKPSLRKATVGKIYLGDEVLGFVKNEEGNKTEEYIFTLLVKAWESAGFSGAESKTIVLNLTNFSLDSTGRSQLVLSCLRFEQSIAPATFNLVILLDTSVTFSFGADEFEEYIREGEQLEVVSVIDCHGFYHLFKRREGRVTPKTAGRINTRDIVQGWLDLDSAQLRNALIYQTNINIGHFGLDNSHIRTHYDLTDFVNRPNVSNFIREDIIHKTCIVDEQKALIIGVGHEQAALDTIGYEIGFNHSNLDYKFVSDLDGVTDVDVNNWVSEYSKIVVLSDVINTGSLVSQVLMRIINLDDGYVNNLYAYAIVKMANTFPLLTKHSIELMFSVDLKRNFFAIQGDAGCLLCDLKQPLLCDDIRSLNDLKSNVSSYLTPLDFWEMVEDSDALLFPTSDHPTFRVKTSRMIKKYGLWLEAVIRKRLEVERVVSMPIDSILTVDEAGGLEFSDLVAKALLGYHDNITVEALSRSSLLVPDYPSDLTRSNRSYLIVDDGINSGATMKGLLDFVDEKGGNIVGVIVLDSRMEQTRIHGLLSGTTLDNIMALYSWPPLNDIHY